MLSVSKVFEGNECKICGEIRSSYENKKSHIFRRHSTSIEEARFGYNGIVKSPTLFLAGEAGSEHVRIKPLKGSKPQKNNIYDWRNFI